ncbi:hypothetical protein [Streptomyces axinellae]|uniref:DUF3349 domain-containing protein n=1 Tax=Streptomyces axinellae TaxID=552788 RepID=A0ABP6C4D3_9ACTN
MTEHRYDPHRALLRVLARALYPHGGGPLAVRSELLRAAWKTSPEKARAHVLADPGELDRQLHTALELVAARPKPVNL